MADTTQRGDEDPSLSTKPYLIRAIHQWALDNGYTPQILVATDNNDVVIPRQYVEDHRIALNIHPQAIAGLDLGNEYVWLSARFSGKTMEITIPISAILAIYTRENGQGIVFQDDGIGIIPPSGPSKKSKSKKKQKKQKLPHLKLVE